jgi:ABC-type Fe3+ transport system substrate-binding protein
MMNHVLLDRTVKEICDQYEGSLQLFIDKGFSQLKDKQVFNQVAPYLSLRSALESRGLEEEQFLLLLEGFAQTEELPEYGLKQNFPPLVALLPCGIRNPFMRLFEEFSPRFPEEINSLIEGNVNHELSYYDYVDEVDSIDNLPDLMITADINNLFHKPFRDKFVRPSYFSSSHPEINPLFKESGLTDPEGEYSFISTNILVMVVDHEILPEGPVPERWEDLLDKRFERSLGIRGEEDFYCHSVTLPYYLLYGEEAMGKLERNIHSCYHPAQMVKAVNSRKEGRPPIFIMPLFFAQKIAVKREVSLIFPEEGAFTSPVSYFVKKEKAEELKPILDFLQGEEVAQMCEELHCPSAYTDSSILPEGKKLYWVGWDTVREGDVGVVKKEIDRLLTEARNEQ